MRLKLHTLTVGTMEDSPQLALHIKFVLVFRFKLHILTIGTIKDSPRLALHTKFVLVIRFKSHIDHGNDRGQSSICSITKFVLGIRFKLHTFTMGTIEDSPRLALNTKFVLGIRFAQNHHGTIEDTHICIGG